MTMPVPFQQFMMHPLQVNPNSHSHPLPPSLDSAHSGASSLSPSNVSTLSSAYPNSTSTAATSPVNSLQAMALLGTAHLMSHHIVNPNSTTRVLLLSDFNKELKTRDIQHVFAEWEDDRGGFKIKWVDDTSCLIVFADPGVAKRAFLGVLSNPPSSLTTIQADGSAKAAKLRAYNKPDVPQILASVQNRPRSRSNASQSLHSRASSIASTGGLGRRPSMGTMAARNRTSLSGPSGLVGRAGSITPLSAAPLGHSDLLDNGAGLAPNGAMNPVTGQINPTNLENADPSVSSSGGSSMRPRIEEAGKRFITSGLSKPASGISHQSISELDENPNTATYNLANLTIEEESVTPTAASH